MNGRNGIVTAIILLTAAAAVLFMVFEIRRSTAAMRESSEITKTQELADRLDSLDYRIYLIGDLPEYMDGVSSHVTIVKPGLISFDTMPVADAISEFTAYDRDGNETDHIARRNYPDYMLIMINTDEDIPDEKWELIRSCAVDNHIPVLLIGKRNIDSFKKYMILVAKDYDDNSTMLFEITREPSDDPIEPAVVSRGGREYADALLELIYEIFEEPPVVYINETEPRADMPEDSGKDDYFEEVTEDAA